MMMNVDKDLLCSIWRYFCATCGALYIISFALYLLPLLYLSVFARSQNLKKRYNATWALVTGGSSGIGKAVVKKLASQGLNVCVVALDDELMTSSISELESDFPDVKFLPVRVDLGRDSEIYIGKIREATADLPISIVINNAGYLVMGFFHERQIETHAANIECNALAAVRISHYFYSLMIQKRLRGCITFTSSAAFFMPSPFASMYGATKAFLSHFATSLAVEAQAHGIDVSVFHPSFTHTNLYAKTPKFGVINALAKFGVQPEHVADIIIGGIGRVIVRDAGFYAMATFYLSRLVDPGALAKIIIPFRDSMAPPGALKRKDV